jgi:hypothetical protein
MVQGSWTTALGCLSVLGVLWFWVTMITPFGWVKQYPGDLLPLLLTILISAVLSAVAGIKASKWWYLVTLANAGTLVWVILRFH